MYRDDHSVNLVWFSTLYSPFCQFRRKDPSSCYCNSIEDRFRVIADFVESKFLHPFLQLFSIMSHSFQYTCPIMEQTYHCTTYVCPDLLVSKKHNVFLAMEAIWDVKGTVQICCTWEHTLRHCRVWSEVNRVTLVNIPQYYMNNPVNFLSVLFIRGLQI